MYVSIWPVNECFFLYYLKPCKVCWTCCYSVRVCAWARCCCIWKMYMICSYQGFLDTSVYYTCGNSACHREIVWRHWCTWLLPLFVRILTIISLCINKSLSGKEGDLWWNINENRFSRRLFHNCLQHRLCKIKKYQKPPLLHSFLVSDLAVILHTRTHTFFTNVAQYSHTKSCFI